jgi:hypothetical protein
VSPGAGAGAAPARRAPLHPRAPRPSLGPSASSSLVRRPPPPAGQKSIEPSAFHPLHPHPSYLEYDLNADLLAVTVARNLGVRGRGVQEGAGGQCAAGGAAGPSA